MVAADASPVLLATAPDAVRWLRARVGGTLRIDSREVQPGDGFIAWPGAAVDGRAFVADAFARGAAACLVEQSGVEAFDFGDRPVAACAGLKAATGLIAAEWFAAPTTQLDVLAVTGTNGKTTTAWWLAQALGRVGRRCGLVGTLGTGVPPDVVANGLTTPDPVLLQRVFRDFVDGGMAACAIEASSIGVAERRLDGSRIRVALFTNFTQDHLDYHGDMAAYWAAKSALFDWPGLQAAVINIDDAQGAALAARLSLDRWTYSADGHPAARLRAEAIGHGDDGLGFTVVEADERHVLCSGAIGQYNVANLLAVIGGLRALGISLTDAVAACAGLLPVPGRMERVARAGQPLVAVDYAHTPDALDKALAALRPVALARGGRLVCLFGCGGGRDQAKRPAMAAIAARGADIVWLTSDNPRHEDPAAILAQAGAGLPAGTASRIEIDRAVAIAAAIDEARPQDVVLVAGKGHETYQEVAGRRLPFSDREQVEAALDRRAASRLPPSATPSPNSMTLSRSMMTLQQAFAWTGGTRLVGNGELPIARIHTDTRTLQPGDLFVALRGERYDANDFLADARASGAVAAIAHGGLEAAGLQGIEVPDSRAALAALAAGWRQRFALPLVAVTGSNGKTTVTQMVASILRAAHGDDAFATQGNFNNDIGVPLTLLRLREHHRAGVVELGMNHPGEIAVLAHIAQPTVALVNNAQREHQEFMHTVEAVAHENGSVLSSLPDSGCAVLPAGDEFTPLWRSLAGQRTCLTFAETAADGADLWLRSADWLGDAWAVTAATPSGDIAFRLAVAGRHNLLNALAASACALAAGVSPQDVAAGLAAFQPVKGRSRAVQLTLAGKPLTLIDDSYNANPDSVRAAIDVLASLPGPRLLVLGDMGEVGDQGPAFHAEAGAHAAARGIETVYTLGALCASVGGAARHFDSYAALEAAVLAVLPQTASVLVKGSRFMQMERAVQAIEAQAAAGAQGASAC
ncbi:bifunctional UDP-N-acetylmuramoyl-L-alanyl-D-glutamate--2,6-diaminopimelate ligase MurE/UDP-N-acetylmuramoyl-tripeptide--D-alanyl-D-alanine ligase MurF [Xylophilus sp. GOD-11R]|uniref:bifunctional UDP-N-acetylmuramoyl-L-alanyl-D-glutamate--2, 6-diaminopimelate ligase MurE/UDP-N-acetylmuramoyl-tripeptide--D-alanyl-D-alanine ligase MurF n=1 Tax=Xylophilus sp. GOD-11R TaxID=3089814 RepID=UPI00298D0A3D|nr:bifunctional UDP-N-acetylmuramoyl-L-alanyl-D-glutamate--2,6-diaminopimelate ligase MurE/UDP-N-acetylmuramoyl-tripeptide--D-alanyl-D-alanine ligase MurF [Xylophilus sp. GOD-11R]WPB56234.1 bifunctional UDP-N-acetylmuramoyl-L-alanyl-D-glutamate--2,6-diaminopimelate ligase MurE/UDP-N-acetylmuramoyl-tripeptide--D-alanyl-D-alanine ligase MurF [Xylophilus sp. GOD-11R]